MSNPARSLQNLYLEEMPVTRSQASRIQRREAQDHLRTRSQGQNQASHRFPHNPHAPYNQAATTHSFTSRRSYPQAQPPVLGERANEGLEANFIVDGIEGLDSGQQRYYAFQLTTPVAVRIYEPDAGLSRIECSCETYRVNRRECIHISVSPVRLIATGVH